MASVRAGFFVLFCPYNCLYFWRMIYFFTPYSFEKKLFEAYDSYINLLPGENDWACLTDGDACFFENNFGHQIQEYINKYPDTGIFTSYASRCGYKFMVPEGIDQNNDSIKYHRSQSQEIYKKFDGLAKEINDHISGHLICVKKSTWQLIRSELFKVCDGANLLGVDTQISNLILGHGLKIRLMRGIYLFHYYRLTEGKEYKEHLIGRTINILIRTSNRPTLFKRCLESVLLQDYKQINILVCTDNTEAANYVREAGISPFMMEKGERSQKFTAPYNLYLNKLLEYVKGDWIFFLDDDDYLANNQVLSKIAEQLTDDNTLYFTKLRWSTGRIIPSDEHFINRKIVRNDISTCSIIFHAKHKFKARFTATQTGDFDFISELSKAVPRFKFINMVSVQCGNNGAYGKAESEIN